MSESSQIESLLRQIQHLESQVESLELALRDRSRAELAMAVANDGLYDWDVVAGTIHFDARYYTMAGYEPEEFPGTFEEWAFRVHPEDFARIEPVVQDYMSGKIPKYDEEFRFRRRSGDWMWIRARVKIVERDQDGEPLRVVGTHSDITERKRAEERNESLREQLHHSSKLDALGHLAGGIAHDFNNVLAGIAGCAELLKLGNEDPRDLAQIIGEAVRRGTDLTGELLAFGRIDPVQHERLDIRTVVTAATNIAERSIDPRIHISAELPDTPAVITGSKSQLESSLINLFTNARDAMPDGGKLAVAVQIASSPNGDMRPPRVQIQVSDNGTGMTDAVLAKAFDPFFTTKDLGKGTGLGLASVYGIVRDHGGEVVVKSTVGVGTTVLLEFPLASSSERVNEATSEAPAAVMPGRGRILIADDDPAVQITTRAILRELGYEAVVVSNGAEAVETYQREADEIDLVLLDIRMPVLDGTQAFALIRQHDPLVPIVMISGNPQDANIENMGDPGAIHLVKKPFQIVTFSQLLAQLLEP